MVGWYENGTPVALFTEFVGIYERHTGADPFALPPTWRKARNKVNLKTPFNFVTNDDINGGNSGNPMGNQKCEVVGLVFDCNIHSLSCRFDFDARLNRTVAVHSQALLEALGKIHPAGHNASP